jgi:hypothetical protein
MVAVQIEYEGGLHCRAVHGPSETALATDAPTDNGGLGEGDDVRAATKDRKPLRDDPRAARAEHGKSAQARARGAHLSRAQKPAPRHSDPHSI